MASLSSQALLFAALIVLFSAPSASAQAGGGGATVPSVRFQKDTLFTNRLFSTQAINIVLPTPLKDFDVSAFRLSIRQLLTGVLPGEPLNSDSPTYDDGVKGQTRTPAATAAPKPTRAPDSNVTAAADRAVAMDALMQKMVLLEVCAYDISDRSTAVLNSHDKKGDANALYEWPRHLCNGIKHKDGSIQKNDGSDNWNGTLVRFSFAPIVTGNGGFGADGMGVIGALVPPSLAGPSSSSGLLLGELNLADALDRNYLTNAVQWQALIGQTAPSRADGDIYKDDSDDDDDDDDDKQRKTPVVTANDFSSIAFRPTFGQMKGRPLATVAGWGSAAADHRPQSIAEIVSQNKGVAAAAIVFIILFGLLCVISCCCVWRLVFRRQGQGGAQSLPSNAANQNVNPITTADGVDAGNFSNINDTASAVPAASEAGYAVQMAPIITRGTTAAASVNRETVESAAALADDAMERANRLAAGLGGSAPIKSVSV